MVETERTQMLANRKKPILGLIAGLLAYVATKAGLDLDPDLAAAISAAIFALVVERVGPIFGEPTPTPQPRSDA